jgi:hypothetical protein
MKNQDLEHGVQHSTSISHWKMIRKQGVLTRDVIDYNYNGAGTDEDPYVVMWLDNDARNPFNWTKARKWFCTLSMALATLSVSFCSSAFAGGKSTPVPLSFLVR